MLSQSRIMINQAGCCGRQFGAATMVREDAANMSVWAPVLHSKLKRYFAAPQPQFPLGMEVESIVNPAEPEDSEHSAGLLMHKLD